MIKQKFNFKTHKSSCQNSEWPWDNVTLASTSNMMTALLKEINDATKIYLQQPCHVLIGPMLVVTLVLLFMMSAVMMYRYDDVKFCQFSKHMSLLFIIFRNITKVVRLSRSLEAETLPLKNTNRPFQMKMVKIPSSPSPSHIVRVRSVTQNISCPVMTHPLLIATCVKSVL